MTAYDDDEVTKAASALGFAAYLIKPIRQSELLDAVAGALSAPAAVPLPAPERRAAAAPRGERVLVVEDHAINQRLAMMQLGRLGFAPTAAANGREAVDSLGAQPVDLILMDCDMPVMDGYAATAEIRKRELRTGAHVTIVAMTANAGSEDREQCIAAGMDDYLSKPVHFADLETVLDKWLPNVQESVPS